MHDNEIERRLRLPAPEEPANLAALVLPVGADDRSGTVGAAPAAYAVSGRTRARPLGGARAAIFLAAVVVLAVAMIAVLQAPSGEVGGPAATPVAATSDPSPAMSIDKPEPSDLVDGRPIPPGRFQMPWPYGPEGGGVHITLPAGWASIGTGPEIVYKNEGRFYGFPVALATHHVSRVATSVCAADPSSPEVGPTFVPIGQTVDDLATAITAIVGTSWSGPTDVTLGGYPAKRLITTYDATVCEGPARRSIWAGEGGWYFVEDGMTSTVHIVDVDAHRLVLTSEVRDASAEEVAQLDAVVASTEIDPPVTAGPVLTASPATSDQELFPMSVGPDGDLRVGSHQAVVEGIPFEFGVPSRGWEPHQGFYVSKSFVGSQAAEAIIRWTMHPDGRHTDPCPGLLSVGSRPTPEQLAAAIASAPGVEPQFGPSVTFVGGRVAQHIVVRVVTHAGCDPGYFYVYEPVDGGANWIETQPGDTIMVWIVDVDGTLVVIEAQHRDDRPVIEDEIRQIVDSVRFR